MLASFPGGDRAPGNEASACGQCHVSLVPRWRAPGNEASACGQCHVSLVPRWRAPGNEASA